MQDLQTYGSSDGSDGPERSSRNLSDQGPPLKRHVESVDEADSAHTSAFATHQQGPKGALPHIVESAGQWSLPKSRSKEQALPAPTTLLDLPLDALGTLRVLYR